MKSLCIQGGRIIDPASGRDSLGDLFLCNGIISTESSEVTETIDASGLIVAPGLIDIHVHLREPGQSYKETIATGSQAAAAGGFTTVVGMPNTLPPIDTKETLTWVQEKIRSSASIHVLSTAALTCGLRGEEVAPLEELAAAGAVAFSDDGCCVQNLAIMREAVERAGKLGIPIMDHCQEASLTSKSVMHEGEWSRKLGFKGWPSLAEEVIVARNILLAEESSHPIHCQHISSGKSIYLLREARSRGIPITGEVSPHHLIFRDEHLRNRDTNFKVNPPLRTSKDQEALLEGIADGTITILASDHAPHGVEEKKLPMKEAPFGMLGLETALALFLTMLFHGRKLLSLSELLAMLTIHPARLLKLDRGTLAPGAPADITLIDPSYRWTYDVNASFSRSRNSPFHGYDFQGRAVRTIVGGETVWKIENRKFSN